MVEKNHLICQTMGALPPERREADSLFFSRYIHHENMRDISGKTKTARSAQAQALLNVRPETIRLVREGKAPKGDPLPVAKVAPREGGGSRIDHHSKPSGLKARGREIARRNTSRLTARIQNAAACSSSYAVLMITFLRAMSSSTLSSLTLCLMLFLTTARSQESNDFVRRELESNESLRLGRSSKISSALTSHV
jgi:hypothetical protein